MLRILTLTLIFVGLSVGAEAKFSTEQKTEIEKIISDYLQSNPEVIAKSLDSMHQKRMQEEEKQLRKAASQYRKELERNKQDPIIGNAKGDVTLVEFFDYNCGYCKMMFPEVLKFVEEDGKVKWVLKENPMLSPTSRIAAKAALAANKQGKYKEIHKAFMEHKGSLDESNIFEIAKTQGLDIEKLKKDMESEEIEKILNANQQLAAKMGVNGVPTFIMNTFVRMGGIEPIWLYDSALKIRSAKEKAKARAKAKASARDKSDSKKEAADNPKESK